MRSRGWQAAAVFISFIDTPWKEKLSGAWMRQAANSLLAKNWRSSEYL
jgi:hypothetical protein